MGLLNRTIVKVNQLLDYLDALSEVSGVEDIQDLLTYTNRRKIVNKTALTNHNPNGVESYPTLIKLDTNPLFRREDQGAIGILWPYMVDMSQDGSSGFALFWSTDHADHSDSGTWLATAPTPEGPWTQHGRVFRDDSTGGKQHETPSVMWDEVNNRWLQYYQLKNVPSYTPQITMVATAPSILDENGNPSQWTVLGVAFSEEYTFNSGDGDATYVKPFRYNGGWYAYSIYGGTDRSKRAFWISNDNGLTYQPHPTIIGSCQPSIQHIDGFDPSDWLAKLNNGVVISYNGELWCITPVGGASSGGGHYQNTKICAMRIMDDGVTFGRAIDITPPLQDWENTEHAVDEIGSVVNWNGKLYATYRFGGSQGGFGLMEIV